MSQNPHSEPLPAIHHRYRGDGWTPDVQRKFIDALAACGSVAEACRVVNRSASTAYRLRARPEATAFRNAWKAATAMAYQQVFAMAMDRAVIGVEQPVYHKGEQVGFKTTYSDRLLCYLLGHLKPADPPPAKPAPGHEDDDDFALAEAVATLNLTEVENGEEVSDEVQEAIHKEQDALQEWRESIEGQLIVRVTDRSPASAHDSPPFEPARPVAPSPSATPAEPASGDTSFAPFPTADDLRAMTSEEREAFDREEEVAFEETIKLGRSVGIEPGTRDADSWVRASL